MAKLQIVGVRDSAVEAFAPPVCVPHIGSALRAFTDDVNSGESKSNLRAHPDDFELFHFGEFDEETGRFSLLDEPSRIARGKDVLHGRSE